MLTKAYRRQEALGLYTSREYEMRRMEEDLRGPMMVRVRGEHDPSTHTPLQLTRKAPRPVSTRAVTLLEVKA
jgi:hypothetical protein